jgi:hypothetical protein
MIILIGVVFASKFDEKWSVFQQIRFFSVSASKEGSLGMSASKFSFIATVFNLPS